ncbi:MAG TPA: NADH-quinone oxidoreductase subunit C [Rhodospirillaceae bacterium]|jgi:NADH-quinone oxidoreductase subunit C|nr:NADH-quinone oxidoreductase subunit C [Alphaproteobacteria bacterium]HBH26317.1 NADH-quinone oxidoreductase subunit C [Rhodospirillaceae bacterium]
MTDALEDLAERVAEALALPGFAHALEDGELVLRPARAEDVPRLLRFLRDDGECGFEVLIDITAADFPEKPQRFEVVYVLLSLANNTRARVHVPVAEGQAVPSVLPLWPCANWYEREVWDMFGIPFSGHPDLRRILCDYGFDGHPLRKDFPLTGHVEVRYDPETARVAYGPVDLVQDYRDFDALSPWEALTGVQARLPGDEKAQGA